MVQLASLSLDFIVAYVRPVGPVAIARSFPIIAPTRCVIHLAAFASTGLIPILVHVFPVGMELTAIPASLVITVFLVLPARTVVMGAASTPPLDLEPAYVTLDSSTHPPVFAIFAPPTRSAPLVLLANVFMVFAAVV